MGIVLESMYRFRHGEASRAGGEQEGSIQINMWPSGSASLQNSRRYLLRIYGSSLLFTPRCYKGRPDRLRRVSNFSAIHTIRSGCIHTVIGI
ncbi:hypothetical protein PISMIDRAFT_404885 [Pisolithus microcarpus 441]|uniref:Uncharacterized protein n=1 Tax=Pisolithus microcarpus 441 TaxID=765257 RepID=A0A0C9YSV1_9AGAM|nr:hypothetical protein PISMIDRAFT_404885 [Pisolithus microcarpus 441]